jgi:hypothetical protein
MKNSTLVVLRLAVLVVAALVAQACTRTVSLRTQYGPVTVVAGPEVRKFEQVRVGYKVVATYYPGVAAQMKKGGTAADQHPLKVLSTYASRPDQEPPSASGRDVTATVEIESVDTSFNTVTFRRPDGFLRRLAVKSPEAREFMRTLRPGDLVEVTYTEAIAVEVEPTQ